MYWNKTFSLIILLVSVFYSGSVFAGEFTVSSTESTPIIEKRKNILTTILDYHTTNFVYKSLAVVIDKNLIEPRGKIQGPRITLSSRVLRDAEFTKLFVHELAHYVDLYYLMSVGGRDRSDDFYAISWKDTTVKRSGEGLSSFVSGYAATNKYEDFAESFTFYIFHNSYFAERALKNNSLQEKYLFFHNEIFPNDQFVGKEFATIRIPSYIWDTTKVPISLQKYLYSLN